MNDIQNAISAIKSNYPTENYTILREALDLAIEVLEEKLNGGWIPCTKRLPIISTEDINRGVSRISVLAISKHRKDVMIRQYEIEDGKFYDGGYGIGVIDNSIVAWQSLPKKSEWRVEG